jgi:peptidoglycan glycosyltransferase
MSASQRQLGGLGALFFLASLGAIAYFVQRQEIPEERDLVRAAATVVPESTPEEPALALPWQERLDLSAAKLVGYGPPAAPLAEGAEAPAVDPASGRLVQELSDGHRILYTSTRSFSRRGPPDLPQPRGPLRRRRHPRRPRQRGPGDGRPLEHGPPGRPAGDRHHRVGPRRLDLQARHRRRPARSKRASAKSKVCFSGGLHGITDDLLTDDPARDERCDDLGGAVAHSHNVVVAKLALKHLERRRPARHRQDLQVRERHPLRVPLRAQPRPDPRRAKERARVAAGFWHVDMSPLHGALLASVFARDGVLQAPARRRPGARPRRQRRHPARPKTERAIAREVAKSVGEMMVRTTTEGTARGSFRDRQGVYYIPDVEVAGKTGSLTGKRAPASTTTGSSATPLPTAPRSPSPSSSPTSRSGRSRPTTPPAASSRSTSAPRRDRRTSSRAPQQRRRPHPPSARGQGRPGDRQRRPARGAPSRRPCRRRRRRALGRHLGRRATRRPPSRASRQRAARRRAPPDPRRRPPRHPPRARQRLSRAPRGDHGSTIAARPIHAVDYLYININNININSSLSTARICGSPLLVAESAGPAAPAATRTQSPRAHSGRSWISPANARSITPTIRARSRGKRPPSGR